MQPLVVVLLAVVTLGCLLPHIKEATGQATKLRLPKDPVALLNVVAVDRLGIGQLDVARFAAQACPLPCRRRSRPRPPRHAHDPQQPGPLARSRTSV